MPANLRERRLERAAAAAARRLEPRIARILAAPLIRKRLHNRALVAWQATRDPLILCRGNINRSPFAELVARHRGKSSAISAGFYPAEDRPVPDRSIALATRYDVDLSYHRSRFAHPSLVDAATAIFIFDLDNLARLAVRHPRALRRTHLIGSLAATDTVVIDDPHGRSDAVLEQAFRNIATAIADADAQPGPA
jgi:protein-tyrosine phosphatase